MTAHVNSNFDGKVLIITRVWPGLCLSHARFTEMPSLVFVRLCQYAGTQQVTTSLSGRKSVPNKAGHTYSRIGV